MGVGIYGALGQAGDDGFAVVTAFGAALAGDRDPLAALPRTGAGAERVHTPGGTAIEIGNLRHAAFGARHRDAADIVVRALADLMIALGAPRVTAFTVD